MRVVLFRAFPEPDRTSVTLYADTVQRRVAPWLSSGEALASCGLPRPRIDGGWRRYWDQHVTYHRYARKHAGDVNHVVDHRYAHLISALPPHRSVVTFHSNAAAEVSGSGWAARKSRQHSVRMLRRAAALICLSESSRREMLGLVSVPEDRIHVIPWGIDEVFRPAVDRQQARRRLGWSGEIVLMVGHTQASMNVERTIRAFGLLVAQHGSAATLVKVGSPFSPEQMRLISELELGNRVQFAGRVAFADLPSYYQAADLLLYAPLMTGFGVPPLEAMACGTPVVASNRGAIPEVVGDGGVLVEAEDESAIADALADVLARPARRRRLVERGFERAARFEWTHIARRLVELYRAIARG